MLKSSPPLVIIIGAGLSGLSAASHLKKHGINFLMLEADERVGGRVKTDLHEGFRLDRGFQVLLNAYPEAQDLLDYEALNLKDFYPGALILKDQGKTEISDPIRKPSALLKTAFSSAGNLLDKLNILKLRQQLSSSSLAQIFQRPEIPTHQVLKDYGFSTKMVQNFFQPFMSGIFLENNLDSSRRVFDFVFKMFSSDHTSVPALGMEEIPKQLASRFAKDQIICNKKVAQIEEGKVICEDGEVFTADKILLATEASSLVSRYYKPLNNSHQSVTCVYFKAPKSPVKRPILILNARKNKFVNNVAVMSQVSPDYAPQDQCLISTSFNGLATESDNDLSAKIRKELSLSLGDEVFSWQFLKSYRIQYALPRQWKVKGEELFMQNQIDEQISVIGDHLLNSSIQGAMQSGRLGAQSIIEQLS